MEPTTIFAATIGAMYACQITFATAKALGIGNHGSKTVDNQRDSWYCFFKVSDLIGNDTETARQNAELERRRQAERQRPRLCA